MRLIVSSLPADFSILKKVYKAINGRILFDVKFSVEHDTLEYVCTLNGLFEENRQELRIISEERPDGMEILSVIRFMQYNVGLKNIFNLFKEEIFEMVQDTLDDNAYAHLRYVLLPL